MATIAIEDVPYNAVEDVTVKNQSIHWKGNVYKPEELRSIIVPDVNYFKVNSMDSVRFSVGYSKFSSVVFIRGIKYSEIPFVYDYERKVDLEPADAVFEHNFIKCYELKEFKVSENPPWVINAKYQKDGLAEGMFMSICLGFFAGLAMWIVVMFIMIGHACYKIQKDIKKTQKLKEK